MKRNQLDRLLYFQRKLDGLFQGLFESELFLPEAEGCIEPPSVDLYVNSENVVVEIELSGVKIEDIKLYMQGDVLVVEGYKEGYRDRHEMSFLCMERQFGRFHRSVELPTIVNTRLIEAGYRDGLLVVKAPRIEDRRGTRRPISVRED